MNSKNLNKASSRANKILSLAGLVGLTAIVILISGLVSVAPKSFTVKTPPQPGYYRVTSVQDGDTFTVSMDGREEKIRLIGVDTPETIKPNSPVECYGVAASNHLKKLLTNSDVRLEADAINQNRDRYDRLLRYAYLSDGTLVNKKIIAEGYGFAYLSFPFTKAEEFRLAQVSARESQLGVWGGECIINEKDLSRPKTNQL